MSSKLTLTWYGHNCWLLKTERHALLIDPFLTGSPTAPIKAADVQADFILISHGHGDHVGDVIDIAARCGSTVISNYEICGWLAERGVKQTSGGNLGGWQRHAFGRVKSTLAFHSSVLPDGANGGNPGGFLFEIDGRRLYFACDTALFSDMQLLAVGGLDLAVLPIGDFFTMGPDDALQAAHWLKAKRVIPCHYGTFPPIEQDPRAWTDRVKRETSSDAIVLQPGETLGL